MSKEIRIEARVRNNLLYHAIYGKWSSVAVFCRQKRINRIIVYNLLNLKISPLGRDGKYNLVCKKLAKIFKVTPDILFPLKLYKIKETKRVLEISFSQLPSLTELKQLPAPSNPEKEFFEAELKQIFSKALLTLTPREEQVLKLLYGFEDEDETKITGIAKQFKVSPTRIRQIRDKALRKLRHRLEIEYLR
jgi:RNA polymerase sigma factor (sigma-70 family)